MPDNYVEKKFLYLLGLSLLLHVAGIALLLNLPTPQPPPPKEPVFIDLQQMPELKSVPLPPTQREARHHAEQRVRVRRETAPRGNSTFDSGPRIPAPPSRPSQQPAGKPSPQPPVSRGEGIVAEGSPVSGLLKPQARQSPARGQSGLFPGARRMASLEESYRRKFENEIAEGDTKFLNTDDIQFGSFLRRFENSVYGVWTYPLEAARNGIEGITPVKITFNRRGEIMHVQLLESSGSRILDDEVFRTLKLLGPVGGFPKGYDKEEFNLIAFFQYGLSRRSLK